MEEFIINSESYQEVRYKTVLSILSTLGIEVNDFGGMIQVKQNGKLIADVQIDKKD